MNVRYTREVKRCLFNAQPKPPRSAIRMACDAAVAIVFALAMVYPW